MATRPRSAPIQAVSRRRPSSPRGTISTSDRPRSIYQRGQGSKFYCVSPYRNSVRKKNNRNSPEALHLRQVHNQLMLEIPQQESGKSIHSLRQRPRRPLLALQGPSRYRQRSSWRRDLARRPYKPSVGADRRRREAQFQLATDRDRFTNGARLQILLCKSL